jgi:hypothetical protein
MYIRSLLLIAALCPVLSLRAGAALSLSAGETFSFVFDNPAPTAGVFAFDIRARLTFSSIDLQEENDSYRLSLFEDVESPTPFDTTLGTGSSRGPISGLNCTITNSSGVAPWRADRDGMLRIEMLTGSLAVESIEITIKGLDSNYYQQTYLVPEPTTTALLVLSISVALLYRRPGVRSH